MPFDELPQSAKRQDSLDGTEAVPQGKEVSAEQRKQLALAKEALIADDDVEV